MDLAEPLPDTPEKETLTERQRARVVALEIARPLLTSTGIASRTPPSLDDLIRLATWVLDGITEPLYPYTDTEATVHLGPAVWMVPDGYLYANGVIYEPVTEEDDDESGQ